MDTFSLFTSILIPVSLLIIFGVIVAKPLKSNEANDSQPPEPKTEQPAKPTLQIKIGFNNEPEDQKSKGDH